MCSLRASTPPPPQASPTPSPAPWLLGVLDIFSLCSALCLSTKWPDISITVVATATRPSLVLLFAARVTLSTHGPGAHLECWSDPFLGARTCPCSLLPCSGGNSYSGPYSTCQSHWLPTGASTQLSLQFCRPSQLPPYFPHLSLSSAPWGGSAEPPPFCGQKAAPASREAQVRWSFGQNHAWLL